MWHFAYRGIALAAVIALSASGQQAISQSVLSVGHPVVSVNLAVASIDLPVEPSHDHATPTLAAAAALNDFPQFDQLYRAAAARGEAPAALAELHSFWTWSLNDPNGAFYGHSTYERLAASYPGYAAYIADFTLVDGRGQTFYPSAETRRFLLAQVQSGAQPVAATRIAAIASKPVSRHSKAAVHAVTVSQSKQRLVVAPVIAAAAAPAPIAEPLPVARVIPMPIRTPLEASAPQDHRLGEALLLTILGLLGVGIVSLILHTPPEERPASRRSQA